MVNASRQPLYEAIINNEPRVRSLDEPLSALDFEASDRTCSMKVAEVQQRLRITFIFVPTTKGPCHGDLGGSLCHGQKEIVNAWYCGYPMMSRINHFVATLSGESNILSGHDREGLLG